MAPSVVTDARLPLLPLPPPEAFASPSKGEGEDEEEEVVLLVVPVADEDVNLEEAAAAASSEVLAAEEEAGVCVEVGSGDVLFGGVSDSGTLASWLQSTWSSAGGITSPPVVDAAATATSQETPLTVDQAEKDNLVDNHVSGT